MIHDKLIKRFPQVLKCLRHECNLCWNACNMSATCLIFVITERHSALSLFLWLKRPCTLMTNSEKPPILLNSKSWICSWHWTTQFYEQLEVSSWSQEGFLTSSFKPYRQPVTPALIIQPALRALGLLLADGALTVGWGKTFWGIGRVPSRKRA